MVSTSIDASVPESRISEYERAVCYYSLPRVSSPVTSALIAAYALCLLEAVAALAYGLWRDDPVWSKWGTIALAAIIAFGVIAFMLRAFLNEVRERRLLSQAHSVTDPTSGFDDLPDPFADHVLYSYHNASMESVLAVQDRDGQPVYRMETESSGTRRVSRRPEGEELFQATVIRSRLGFVLQPNGRISRVRVTHGDKTLATIRRLFSLGPLLAEVTLEKPESATYVIRGGTIFFQDTSVGHIYDLRDFTYLDIDSAHFNDGILAYFLTMT